jgi:exodeoxyribonuclease-3
MSTTIATWNINSIRPRVDIVGDFLDRHSPDILCLQEIKCRTEQFPLQVFHERGYDHVFVNGQKGYHGVAIASKRPFVGTSVRGFCGKNDARHAAVTVRDGDDEMVVHNFYVPAGGDEPDPSVNEKFAHKLAFLGEMESWLKGGETDRKAILVGDLNIAPHENDVWSHKQLLNVVSHTPIETESLDRLRNIGGWVDAIRHFVPTDRKLYTWWSYRAIDWAASDRGRRLDHIWVTPHLAPRLGSIDVVRDARGWKRPSDHVPVVATIAAA